MDGIDRYFGLIAASVLSGIVITVMVGFEPARSFFCSKDETACSREWISALSGWAAFVAAIFTVVYLRRQIADVAEHHREITEIQLMPVTAIVRQTLNRILCYQYYATELTRISTEMALSDQFKSFTPYYRALAENHQRQLRDILQDETLSSFEKHVGSGAPFTLRQSAIMRLKKAADTLLSAEQQTHDDEKVLAMHRFAMELEWAVSDAERYLEEVTRSANNYLSRWSIL